ncbi:MoaD/ThiS family protein [Campylobacter upsaliensis]|uniref:MoaD/ThiS family protein n=1 Tax=Campylobacter upsaliensis TaxID=28080 RepID=UPI0013BED9D6|nr:MoaD/ThiS family protein [Campylobacter upsaliensis]EAH6864069.1 MoaD/ThiS family protein [Campylobacter upsaliensis]EAH8208431.1 MoaD/ThiS family protein [Campylobacter upsaliensis]EAH8308244.1 MoaD/ThiS family protein [Campylobacter upsaliensis]EDP6857414.1 molybdopterin synthase sulfur carrier subunit [Campylobacter upsaliensis]EFV1646304.1 MoaD/ThiS family protein [Campylobacter upsaliensis]
MVTIEFLGPINKPNLKLEISSLKELKEILKQDESLKEWLELCAVCLNGVIVFDENVSLKSGDTIALLPPVCGG